MLINNNIHCHSSHSILQPTKHFHGHHFIKFSKMYEVDIIIISTFKALELWLTLIKNAFF